MSASYQQARYARNLRLVNEICDVSFGSLWWVKNELWRRQIKDFDIAHPECKNHPGLALGCGKYTSLMQMVPMLLGSHSHKKGFPVKGLTEKERDCRTFFVEVYPCPCAFEVNNVLRLGKDPGFERNKYKSKVSDQEMIELRKYLVKKGVKF